MVKKSGPKLTGKKKSTAKKKSGSKKPARTSEAVKKAAAKSKVKAKSKPKKPAAPKKAKVSIKDLLLRKFDTGVVASKGLYTPKPTTAEIPDSLPFVTGQSAKETERIKALLLKAFDLEAEPRVKEVPKPVTEEIERPMPPMPPPSVSGGGASPVTRAMIIGLCGLAMLITLVIGASFSNNDKFYVKEAHGAVQVWQGKFAPVGSELVMSLDGMKMPSPVHDVYSKEEAYGMVYNHFLSKADALLNEPGWPDFRKVNAYLRQAGAHAPTVELRQRVQHRLNGLNFLVLLHRSDVALASGKMGDLQAAEEHLKKAGTYASADYQRELVERRRVVVEGALAKLATQ